MLALSELPELWIYLCATEQVGSNSEIISGERACEGSEKGPLCFLAPFFPCAGKKRIIEKEPRRTLFYWLLFLGKVTNRFIHEVILKVVSLSLSHY